MRRTRQSSGRQRYSVPTAQVCGSPRVCVPDGTGARDDGEKCKCVKAVRATCIRAMCNLRCAPRDSGYGEGKPRKAGASATSSHLSAKCLECLAGLLVGLGSAICYSFFCEFLHSLFYKIFLLPYFRRGCFAGCNGYIKGSGGEVKFVAYNKALSFVSERAESKENKGF